MRPLNLSRPDGGGDVRVGAQPGLGGVRAANRRHCLNARGGGVALPETARKSRGGVGKTATTPPLLLDQPHDRVLPKEEALPAASAHKTPPPLANFRRSNSPPRL